jgi:hypothetical protein
MLFFKKKKNKKVEEKNTPETVQQKQDEKIEIQEAEVKNQTNEVNTQSKDKPANKPASKENNDNIYKYHISQNKDDQSEFYKQWRVRKEGSNKTIKYFKTQKEAIEHAEILAKNAGSSIVIHKVDGTIRKQDYSK